MRAAAKSSAPRPTTPPSDAPQHRSDATGRPTRVIVADDSDQYRAGLVRAINASSDLDLVADVSGGTAAITAARALIPDVLLIDYRMPDLDGWTAAQIMRAEQPGLRIVLMSAHREELFQRLARDHQSSIGMPCDVVVDKAVSRRELLDHTRAQSQTPHSSRDARLTGA